MKLFNAQSAKKQETNTEIATATNKALDSKVLVAKDLLAAVAGGFNDNTVIWPPVKPK
ncbi:MAG: hypothetical protein KKB45_16855 [Gammaproteobacteria bacterium]|nr:hypothetical protein [Gammaproteobacteria bacterium]MBU2280462.1 hypothetical protein [Gammaproteobacteria bacterium]